MWYIYTSPRYFVENIWNIPSLMTFPSYYHGEWIGDGGETGGSLVRERGLSWDYLLRIQPIIEGGIKN